MADACPENITDTIIVSQVDCSNLPSTEEDTEAAVGRQGPDGNGFARESFRHFPQSTLEADIVPGGGDAAHDLMTVVLDLGKLVGHGAGTGTIAAGRDIQIERLVRSLQIIDAAPPIESGLQIG
jgi:hypothetical protein